MNMLPEIIIQQARSLPEGSVSSPKEFLPAPFRMAGSDLGTAALPAWMAHAIGKAAKRG